MPGSPTPDVLDQKWRSPPCPTAAFMSTSWMNFNSTSPNPDMAPSLRCSSSADPRRFPQERPPTEHPTSHSPTSHNYRRTTSNGKVTTVEARLGLRFDRSGYGIIGPIGNQHVQHATVLPSQRMVKGNLMVLLYRIVVTGKGHCIIRRLICSYFVSCLLHFSHNSNWCKYF